MPMFATIWLYLRRVIEGLVLWALWHGIVLWLASVGIHPDQWVDQMITGATRAPWWMDLVISGSLGLVSVFLIEKFVWGRRNTLALRPEQLPPSDEIALQKVLERQRVEDTKAISTEIAALELRFGNAKRAVRECTAERDKAEVLLRDSPSPSTSNAYRIADEKLGAAWREQDAIRVDLLRVTGSLPKEPPYMTAYEVIHYLADESEWGERVKSVRVENNINPHYPMHKQPLLEAPIEFRRIAEQGEISAVGRENGMGAPVPISETYWMVATISPFSLRNPDVSETIPAVPDTTGIQVYKGVKILRADVYKAWPRASRQDEQARNVYGD